MMVARPLVLPVATTLLTMSSLESFSLLAMCPKTTTSTKSPHLSQSHSQNLSQSQSQSQNLILSQNQEHQLRSMVLLSTTLVRQFLV